MLGLMMDYQLNVPAILRRADELYGDREIVSRLPDKTWHRFTYANCGSKKHRMIFHRVLKIGDDSDKQSLRFRRQIKQRQHCFPR